LVISPFSWTNGGMKALPPDLGRTACDQEVEDFSPAESQRFRGANPRFANLGRGTSGSGW
jgi:hypothetical protein